MPVKKLAKTMDDLLTELDSPPLAAGDLVEAKIANMTKYEIWLDLGYFGVGLVPRREAAGADLKVGDEVSVSVVDPESDLGYPILSLKKVTKEQGWDRLIDIFKNAEIVTVYAFDANRGGLLVEVEGIRGFLPVSQLSAEHYPRVANADKDEILSRLQSLIKQPLNVRILDLDRDQSKLILSEKEAARENTKQKLSKIKIGDVVEGEVTGCVEFGVFVTVGGIEGLVHISELAWERVTNPQDLFKVGDKIKVKVIAIDNDKLSLSVKQLSPDPWLKEVGKLKVGDKVKGTITRITPFGAFVQLAPAIEALVHVSELTEDDPNKKLVIGSSHEFRILEIDNAARKVSLTTKAVSASTKKRPSKKSVSKPK